MDKNYKVVPFTSSINNFTTELRFCVVSTDTGEILDDAQGYGFKTAQKAHAAFVYKNRDRSKDKEKRLKISKIKQWFKDNDDFKNQLDIVAFDFAKGLYQEKFSAKTVKQLLQENNLQTEFSASDLLKVWKTL